MTKLSKERLALLRISYDMLERHNDLNKHHFHPSEFKELLSHIDALEWELNIQDENLNSMHQTNQTLLKRIDALEGELQNYKQALGEYRDELEDYKEIMQRR